MSILAMPSTTFEDLTRLHSCGRVEESVAAVQRLLQSTDGQDAATGAFFALSINYYKKFGAALAVLAPAFEAYESNFEACSLVALGAFVLKDLDLCTAASRRCIALMPARNEGYIRLGMVMMLFERYREAYEVLSEGLSRCTSGAAALRYWWAVAEHRMRCDEPVTVRFEGNEYRFEIATFSGHALEASALFLQGRICEAEELRFARGFVKKCRSYVEVGSSVGTHAVVFAKTLCLESVHVFDASADAVRQTGKNLVLNGIDRTARVALRNRVVGAESGRMTFDDKESDFVNLDGEVGDGVEFMKIDVDGMEMAVLDGCRGLINRDSPKLMIEVADEFVLPFRKFAADHGYAVAHSIPHPGYANYFLAKN
jgi:hypothetical protein